MDPSCCPVCGITLRSSDLEVHFVQELERLERVSRSFRSSAHHGGSSSISPSGSSGMSAPAATSQVQKREQDTRWEVKREREPWIHYLCDLNFKFGLFFVGLFFFFYRQTFHRIRINRTNRVRAKARKRRADEREDTPENGPHATTAGCSSTPCPICGQRMYGSAEELNQHVVQCLRRASFTSLSPFLYHKRKLVGAEWEITIC